jgi:hypothetical protein
MKKCLYLMISLYLLSCNKDNNNASATTSPCYEPISTFRYKWNNVLYEMTGSLTKSSKEGSLIRKEQTTNSGASNPFDNNNGDALNNTKYLYSIAATKNYFYSDDGEPLIEIELRTSNFNTLRSYSNSSSEIKLVRFFHPLDATLTPNQQFSVTLTRIENGYADGNFIGTVVTSNNQTISITEGEFKNVKILE